MKIAVLAVKACISKSILPTYGRFSRARSHIVKRAAHFEGGALLVCRF